MVDPLSCFLVQLVLHNWYNKGCGILIFCVTTLVHQRLLDLVHLKKDHTYVYQQLFMEIRDRCHGHIPDYTDGSGYGNDVACATVFPSNRNCLIQHLYLLLNSGKSLKPWKIKQILLHPNTLILQTHFHVPSFTIYEA